jgi:hypothetical protein
MKSLFTKKKAIEKRKKETIAQFDSSEQTKQGDGNTKVYLKPLQKNQTII